MGERILGVDPGLETTGYGLIETAGRQVRHLAGGIVVTRADAPLTQRLSALHARMAQLLEELKPRIVVLEELYAHYQHPMTAILMGHARGVITLAVAQRDIQLVCYLPTRVKKAITGHGHATKTQVQGMVTSLLGLPSRPEPDDVSDALALALTYARTLDRPALAAVVKARRRLPSALQEVFR